MALPWTNSSSEEELELCFGHAHQLELILTDCQHAHGGSGLSDEIHFRCSVAGTSLLLQVDPEECDHVVDQLNELISEYTMGDDGRFQCEEDGHIKNIHLCNDDTAVLNEIVELYQTGNFVGCDVTTPTTTPTTTASTMTTTQTTSATTTPFGGKIQCFSDRATDFLTVPINDSCSRQSGYLDEIVDACSDSTTLEAISCTISEVNSGYQIFTFSTFQACQFVADALNTAKRGFSAPYTSVQANTIGCSPGHHLVDLACDETAITLNDVIDSSINGQFDDCRITTVTTTPTSTQTTTSTTSVTTSITSSVTTTPTTTPITTPTTSYTSTITSTSTTTATSSATTTPSTTFTTTPSTSQTTTMTTSPITSSFSCHEDGYITIVGANQCGSHVRVLNHMVSLCNEGSPGTMSCTFVDGISSVLIQAHDDDCVNAVEGVNKAISGHQMGTPPRAFCSPGGFIRFDNESDCLQSVPTLNRAITDFQAGNFVNCEKTTETTTLTTTETSSLTTTQTSSLTTTPTSTAVNSKFSCASYDGRSYLAIPLSENCGPSTTLLNSMVDTCAGSADPSITPALAIKVDLSDWRCNNTVIPDASLLNRGSVTQCNSGIQELTEIVGLYTNSEDLLQLRCSPEGFIDVSESSAETCDEIAILLNSIVYEYEYGFFGGCRQTTPTTTQTTSATSTVTTTLTSTETSTGTTTQTETPTPITISDNINVEAQLTLSAEVPIAGLGTLDPSIQASLLEDIQINLVAILFSFSGAARNAESIVYFVTDSLSSRRRQSGVIFGIGANSSILFNSFPELRADQDAYESGYAAMVSDAINFAIEAQGLSLSNVSSGIVIINPSNTFGVEPSTDGEGNDRYQAALISSLVIVLLLLFVFGIALYVRKKNASPVGPSPSIKLDPDSKRDLLSKANGSPRNSSVSPRSGKRWSLSKKNSRSSLSATRIVPAPFVAPPSPDADLNPFDVKKKTAKRGGFGLKRKKSSPSVNRVQTSPFTPPEPADKGAFPFDSSVDRDPQMPRRKRFSRSSKPQEPISNNDVKEHPVGSFGKNVSAARQNSTDDPFSDRATAQRKKSVTSIANSIQEDIKNQTGLSAPRKHRSSDILQTNMKPKLPELKSKSTDERDHTVELAAALPPVKASSVPRSNNMNMSPPPPPRIGSRVGPSFLPPRGSGNPPRNGLPAMSGAPRKLPGGVPSPKMPVRPMGFKFGSSANGMKK